MDSKKYAIMIDPKDSLDHQVCHNPKVLVSCPFSVITFGWVQQQTHPKVMTGNEQLTRGAFIINDFLRNPHFSI